MLCPGTPWGWAEGNPGRGGTRGPLHHHHQVNTCSWLYIHLHNYWVKNTASYCKNLSQTGMAVHKLSTIVCFDLYLYLENNNLSSHFIKMKVSKCVFCINNWQKLLVYKERAHISSTCLSAVHCRCLRGVPRCARCWSRPPSPCYLPLMPLLLRLRLYS